MPSSAKPCSPCTAPKAKTPSPPRSTVSCAPAAPTPSNELCLEPDTLSNDQKTEIRHALARSIKVNARPLTIKEWTEFLGSYGFTVIHIEHAASMELLKLRRNLADEGFRGVATIAFSLLRNPGARKRVLGMHEVF